MSIYFDYVVTVKGNEAQLDNTIFLYQGNRNIDYYFTIKEAPFRYSKPEGENIIEKLSPSHAAVTLLRTSDKVEVGTGKAVILKDKIKLTITKEMIDETVEVGKYTMVIDLLDDEKDSVATLPPIVNQFEILPRITSLSFDGSNVVNEAVVGQAVTTSSGESLSIFDDQGNYIKTVWQVGDKIVAEKLNKIEEAIYQNTTKCNTIAKDLIIESGKIYLKKEDGAKIGLGVTLPTVTNGREIELQKSSTHIQWRYVGDSVWTNLIAIDELKVKGDTGATPNIQIGTVETLASGSNATASIGGTVTNPLLNLGIPRGADGGGSGGTEKVWTIIADETIQVSEKVNIVKKNYNALQDCKEIYIFATINKNAGNENTNANLNFKIKGLGLCYFCISSNLNTSDCYILIHVTNISNNLSMINYASGQNAIIYNKTNLLVRYVMQSMENLNNDFEFEPSTGYIGSINLLIYAR